MSEDIADYTLLESRDGQFTRLVAVPNDELAEGARTIGFHYNPEDARPVSHMAAQEVFVRLEAEDDGVGLVYYAEPVAPVG